MREKREREKKVCEREREREREREKARDFHYLLTLILTGGVISDPI